MILENNRKVCDIYCCYHALEIDRYCFDFIQPTRPTTEWSGVRIRNYLYIYTRDESTRGKTTIYRGETTNGDETTQICLIRT